MTDLSRHSKISVITLKKLLYAFEGIFLIRNVDGVYYFEDQGMATHLAGESQPRLLRALLAQLPLLARFSRKLNTGVWARYATRGGATVPLVYSTPGGEIGFIPTESERPLPSELASARSFRKKHPRSKVLLVHTGHQWVDLDVGIFQTRSGRFINLSAQTQCSYQIEQSFRL